MTNWTPDDIFGGQCFQYLNEVGHNAAFNSTATVYMIIDLRTMQPSEYRWAVVDLDDGVVVRTWRNTGLVAWLNDHRAEPCTRFDR